MWQLIGFLVFAGAVGVVFETPPAAAQERTCYAMVDVTTTLDEPAGSEWDFWKELHQVSVADDSSIITNRTIEYGGQELKMQIWPLKGRFEYDYARKDGTTGHSEVKWSNPPQIWCSDDLDYGLEVSATSTRNVAGGGKFGTNPAQMFCPPCNVRERTSSAISWAPGTGALATRRPIGAAA